jgi:hypothetical protein
MPEIGTSDGPSLSRAVLRALDLSRPNWSGASTGSAADRFGVLTSRARDESPGLLFCHNPAARPVSSSKYT